MKFGIKCLCLVILISGFLFIGQPCVAQDPSMEQVGNSGAIDWVGQKVVAKGIGAPPQKYYGTPQARPLAMRAAVTAARRNLLEVIKGVYIDSTTRVENNMATDDTIVAKVRGLLQNSSIDNYEYMSDGTIEATVSMALSGQLGETLMKMSIQSAPSPAAVPAAPDMEVRIRQLEDRVNALERQVSGLNRASYEQEEMIFLFKRFVTTWMEYAASGPVLIQAGLESKEELAGISEKIAKQETRLASISKKLDEMAKRLSVLESTPPEAAIPAVEMPKSGTPYTGLVIDARNTGFRPCLRPEVFGGGQLLYPGTDIDNQKAIRTGFVRYYREIGQAEKSERVGSLPYTIKAKGTFKGNRSLEIDSQAYKTLNDISAASGNFLSAGMVVIVF